MRSVCLFCLLVFSTVNGEVAYRNPAPSDEVQVISRNAGEITIAFSLNTLDVHSSLLDGFGAGSVFRIPGAGPAAVIGFPDVPGLRRMIRVPDAGKIALEIIDAESFSLGFYSIPPFQPLSDRCATESPPTRICSDFYEGSLSWPEIPLAIESVDILRDVRVAWLRFQPVSWNPETGEVTVTTSLVARISAEPEEGANELIRPQTGITRSFLPQYGEVLGFETNGLDVIDGSYVFISSQEGLDLVQELIDWKNRKGYLIETGIVPDIGTTPEDIDAWIENAYNTWPCPPEYILIVGDEGVVPPPIFNGFAADNIYGVVGEGCVPSIHVGRICGGDTDDLPYIAWKIREHEMNPWQPAVSWFQKGISIGHTEFVANSWDYVEYMMAAGMVPTWFCDDGGIPVTIPTLSDSINSGCSLIGLCGHGDVNHFYPPGFSNTDVAALTNGRKLPWVALVACQNGMFNGYYCISEALMGEGDFFNPRGAIGVMSPTTNSPYGAADSLVKWIFKGYLQEEIHHMGAVTDWSKEEVYEYYGGSAVQNNHMHMIFGCPEMDIYYDTAPLSNLDCGHPDPIVSGPVTLTVTAEGLPVEGALVAIKVYDPSSGNWMDSDYTDAAGSISLVVPSFAAGSNVYVTATAFNCSPYLFESVTGAEDPTGAAVLPLSLDLHPSPFSGMATVSYTLPCGGKISLGLFDTSGRLVRELGNEQMPAGSHSLVLDDSDGSGALLPSGLYFCRLETTAGNLVRSIVLLR
jgi:hypothetical protein